MMSGSTDAAALFANTMHKMALLLRGKVVTEDIARGNERTKTIVHLGFSLLPRCNVATQQWHEELAQLVGTGRWHVRASDGDFMATRRRSVAAPLPLMPVYCTGCPRRVDPMSGWELSWIVPPVGDVCRVCFGLALVPATKGAARAMSCIEMVGLPGSHR